MIFLILMGLDMGFIIRMGIPEMLELWTELQTKYRNGTIKKKEEELYKNGAAH